MGLLTRIENRKGRTGLLARVTALEEKSQGSLSQIDFYSLIESFKLKKCAVFCRIQDFYVMSDSCGFDLQTISSSISTRDFWNGFKLKEQVWNCFSGEQLIPFLQLFSSEEKSQLDFICILPFKLNGEKAYFLATDKKITKENSIYKKLSLLSFVKPDFKKDYFDEGLSLSEATFFIATPKLSLQSAFNNYDERVVKIMRFTALKQIYFYLKKLFQKPNACFFDESGEFKIAIFSKEELIEKFLETLINTSLKSFFNNSATSNMLVIKAGICTDAREITDFLTQG